MLCQWSQATFSIVLFVTHFAKINFFDSLVMSIFTVILQININWDFFSSFYFRPINTALVTSLLAELFSKISDSISGELTSLMHRGMLYAMLVILWHRAGDLTNLFHRDDHDTLWMFNIKSYILIGWINITWWEI